nr:hypothetical protein [Phytohabitans suffuscus]
MTRCWEKRSPWYASDTPWLAVVTKNVVEVAYRAGVRAVTSAATPAAAATASSTSHHRLRTACR